MPSVREAVEACGVSTQAVRDFAKRTLQTSAKSQRRALQLTDKQTSIVGAHFSKTASSPAKQAAKFADDFAVRLQDLEVENAALRAERDGLHEQVMILCEQLAKREAREAEASEALAEARRPWVEAPSWPGALVTFRP